MFVGKFQSAAGSAAGVRSEETLQMTVIYCYHGWSLADHWRSWVCIAWESVSAEALTGVAALGSLTLPDAEVFLSFSGAVVVDGD